ncbi:NfrA family protein [Variovorax ginsengisoli]|uniref:Tetratricopeptide (TPR) repeat protein n=1 Tax=Variovorax ginsengisoli TaxID=363844 RepID=A0ABT9S8F9_9BURK|nr:hypothetical protein [Variovorax ginsengisoli]MDP9900641.1 tetratricopeptide (TPR) repeat protein [Variovorax ginsengisoli]
MSGIRTPALASLKRHAASHTPCLPWLAALAAVCSATAVQAAPAVAPASTPAPIQSADSSQRRPRPAPALQGRAWQLADAADKAYARGDYGTALARADAALRLRPDVPRLYQLRVYALQQLGRTPEAVATAAQALAAGHGSPALQAALTNLQPASSGGAGAASDAYRRAFPLAAQAYADDARGNAAAAAKNAEAAFRIDPTQGDWALLWIDALQKQNRFGEAVDAARTAIAAGAPNPDAIHARVDAAQRATASRHAEAAYQAIARGQPGEGVQQARDALRLAPTVSAYRWLLLDQLRSTGQPMAAEQAATQMLQGDAGQTAVRLLRSVLRQQLGRADAAQEDIDVLLRRDDLTDAARRDARLIGADLALVADRPARTLALLAPLPADDAQAIARRHMADAASGWRAPGAPALAAVLPLQLCHDGGSGTVCELKPWDDPGTDQPVARANAAYGQKRYAQAIAFARAAVGEDPSDASRQTLLTTTLAAGDLWQRDEALQRLNRAIAARPGDATLLRQRAFLHQADGHPALALADFVAARATGHAPPQNVLDEAYARAAIGDRPTAAALLHQALDAAALGTLPLDAQQRYDTRSSATAFAREWGASVTVGYRGARAASSGLFGQPVSVPGNPVFSTTELFWRPPAFLNSSSRTFEVYGRMLQTLRSGTDTFTSQVVDNPCGGSFQVAQSQSRGIAGLPTTTGALGVRFTPSTEMNVVFGLERQFMIGSATRSGALDPEPAAVRCQFNTRGQTLRYQSDTGSGGWQAYVAYGVNQGTAIRMDTNQWFTMEGYVQAGYAWRDMPAHFTLQDSASGAVEASGDGRLRRGQGFASGELRVGRSYMTAYSDRLVIFPHVVAAADWSSVRQRVQGVPVSGFDRFDLQGNGASWSAGAGLGVNLRYWLREDRYNAQRSRLDASLQYRASLGGGQADRAKGLFLTVSLSY